MIKQKNLQIIMLWLNVDDVIFFSYGKSLILKLVIKSTCRYYSAIISYNGINSVSKNHLSFEQVAVTIRFLYEYWEI